MVLASSGIELRPATIRILHRQQILEAVEKGNTVFDEIRVIVHFGKELHLMIRGTVIDGAADAGLHTLADVDAVGIESPVLVLHPTTSGQLILHDTIGHSFRLLRNEPLVLGLSTGLVPRHRNERDAVNWYLSRQHQTGHEYWKKKYYFHFSL